MTGGPFEQVNPEFQSSSASSVVAQHHRKARLQGGIHRGADILVERALVRFDDDRLRAAFDLLQRLRATPQRPTSSFSKKMAERGGAVTLTMRGLRCGESRKGERGASIGNTRLQKERLAQQKEENEDRVQGRAPERKRSEPGAEPENAGVSRCGPECARGPRRGSREFQCLPSPYRERSC